MQTQSDYADPGLQDAKNAALNCRESFGHSDETWKFLFWSDNKTQKAFPKCCTCQEIQTRMTVKHKSQWHSRKQRRPQDMATKQHPFTKHRPCHGSVASQEKSTKHCTCHEHHLTDIESLKSEELLAHTTKNATAVEGKDLKTQQWDFLQTMHCQDFERKICHLLPSIERRFEADLKEHKLCETSPR